MSFEAYIQSSRSEGFQWFRFVAAKSGTIRKVKAYNTGPTKTLKFATFFCLLRCANQVGPYFVLWFTNKKCNFLQIVGSADQDSFHLSGMPKVLPNYDLHFPLGLEM